MSHVKLPCLYTKQKRKKKKAWSDGVIHLFGQYCSSAALYESEDGAVCIGNPLEIRTLNANDKIRILNGKACDIEFENYLVSIEESISDNKPLPSAVSSLSPPPGSKVGIPNVKRVIASPQNSSQQSTKSSHSMILGLKLKKFKPPTVQTPNFDESRSNAAPKSDEDLQSHRISRYSNQTFANEKSRESLGKRNRGAYEVEDDELDDIWDGPSVDSKSRSHEDIPRQNYPSKISYDMKNNHNYIDEGDDHASKYARIGQRSVDNANTNDDSDEEMFDSGKSNIVEAYKSFKKDSSSHHLRKTCAIPISESLFPHDDSDDNESEALSDDFQANQHDRRTHLILSISTENEKYFARGGQETDRNFLAQRFDGPDMPQSKPFNSSKDRDNSVGIPHVNHPKIVNQQYDAKSSRYLSDCYDSENDHSETEEQASEENIWDF